MAGANDNDAVRTISVKARFRSRLRGGGIVCLLFLLAIPAAQGASILNFPRLSFESGALTGIAIVNPSGQDAVATVTAFGADGRPLTGAGFQNQAVVTVTAG